MMSRALHITIALTFRSLVKTSFYQMYRVSQSFLIDVELCIRGHSLSLEDPGLIPNRVNKDS